ncbi:Mechanosensitive ion channel [Plasmodiophora brassicae]|uniref:Uncharacterized protein n=1 Tax=Plasmodiophora brassicae TaxID=37360 RepID=A0A0G4IHA8_PLABS|nr:hypothetical protein PBRA_000282 [Plasmodiophora brassicae]SPQ96843.1 unnamed protein product [Plasmodiophora brassicae]
MMGGIMRRRLAIGGRLCAPRVGWATSRASLATQTPKPLTPEEHDNKANSGPSKSGRLTRLYMKILPVDDTNLRLLLGQSLAAGTYAMVGLSVLGTLGVDTAPLLAGLGSAGVTLGFALKDVASNAIAGFSLAIERPFVVGDIVHVGPGQVRGRVFLVSHRYVHLDLLSNKDDVLERIMIPSHIVQANPIVVELQKQK